MKILKIQKNDLHIGPGCDLGHNVGYMYQVKYNKFSYASWCGVCFFNKEDRDNYSPHNDKEAGWSFYNLE